MKEQLFDPWPDKYRGWFNTPIGSLVKDVEQALMMQMVQPSRGDYILDVGCGSGIFTEPLIDQGAQVVGVDLSQPMLNAATHLLADKAFAGVGGDIASLPFCDEQFDKAVSITALEFVEDAETALAELFRVTRKGGMVVVATLNSLSPWAARRSSKAKKDQTSVFRQAYFRSPDDLRALRPEPCFIQTAVHFNKDSAPADAVLLEVAGQRIYSDTGAFVIACWNKPLS